VRKICNKYYVRIPDAEYPRFVNFVFQHPDVKFEVLSNDMANGRASIFCSVIMDEETELAMRLACDIASCLQFTRTLDKFVDKK
jgi:hypothetical protein